jgi:hypothetical protein
MCIMRLLSSFGCPGARQSCMRYDRFFRLGESKSKKKKKSKQQLTNKSDEVREVKICKITGFLERFREWP